MRRARPVHLMLAAGIAACLAAPLSVSAQDVAIAGATLIDGNGGPAIPNAVVVIHGDRISAVGARGDVSIPGDAPSSTRPGAGWSRASSTRTSIFRSTAACAIATRRSPSTTRARTRSCSRPRRST